MLAEHATATGNFVSVSRLILEKISDTSAGKMSYAYDSYCFHYASSGGLIFLCMSDAEFSRRVAFAFLQDVKQRFLASYEAAYPTAMAFQMNQEFSRVLARQMEYFSFDPRSDKIANVKDKIEDTKQVMVENIERIFDRGERMELLVSKTNELADSSFAFKQTSRNLKWTMCLKNYKLWAVIIVMVFLLLLLVVWFICGLTFQRCGNS